MEGSIAGGWEEDITAGVSQPGRVGVGLGGFWMQEEVDQKRNGSGRLGLPSKTQVDMGIRERGLIQTQLSPMSSPCSG